MGLFQKLSMMSDIMKNMNQETMANAPQQPQQQSQPQQEAASIQTADELMQATCGMITIGNTTADAMIQQCLNDPRGFYREHEEAYRRFFVEPEDVQMIKVYGLGIIFEATGFAFYMTPEIALDEFCEKVNNLKSAYKEDFPEVDRSWFSEMGGMNDWAASIAEKMGNKRVGLLSMEYGAEDGFLLIYSLDVQKKLDDDAKRMGFRIFALAN
ncbi:MAG TPA: hypothetical protein PLZ77_01020 [Lachnospiraceae bacterium]|nr:hypothetical protein [Lachnospiraceae bacterium]